MINLSENIDIQKEYNMLNALLFKNELKPVKLVWNTSKTVGGIVKYSDIASGFYVIKSLEISKYYDIDYEAFRNILAHEMIHVYHLQNNIRESGSKKHGRRFEYEMWRINEMNVGINVTILCNSSRKFDILVTGKNKSTKAVQPVVIVLITHISNNNFINSCLIWDEKMMTNGDREAFEKRINDNLYQFNNHAMIKYFRSFDPNWITRPVSKKVPKSLKLYAIEKDELTKLYKESKIDETTLSKKKVA